MRFIALPLTALSLLILSAPAAQGAGLPLPSKSTLLKPFKADVDAASQSILPPWSGPKWEYLSAPLAKLDAAPFANPVTATAAALVNTVIDDGVRIQGAVVSLQYLGDRGWELVSLHNGIAYFKRPKPADPIPEQL
ncbi:hypothetical protein J7643_04170 [bacterium]|nr:hypothetical protein [bacterium]